MIKHLPLCAVLTLALSTSSIQSMCLGCLSQPKVENLASRWDDYMKNTKSRLMAHGIVKKHCIELRKLKGDKQLSSIEKLAKKSIQDYVSQLDFESKRTVKQVMDKYEATIALQVLGQLY